MSYRRFNLQLVWADNTTQIADSQPAWSPGGSRTALMSARDEIDEIYPMNADGSSLLNPTNDPAQDSFHSWASKYSVKLTAPSM
jgi:Tol biopolymer transport system component